MTLPSLHANQFDQFFEAVWGYKPFPWQSRLAQEVGSRGRWPDLLDLPTGSGKTAAIDVAVFDLALQADRGEARRAAMRIAFVVDRRLIVDDAFERAKKLANALLDATRSDQSAAILQSVAKRLQQLAGDGQPPLIARFLRGGAPREDDWARTPRQPTVLCSTVDQVGSRLLFRGYGVSDRMKPVQAGLLGSDALILLDEAHLSQPFRQTAQAIGRCASLRGPDQATFGVALLTATPGEVSGPEEWRFDLRQEDREHSVLARRMAASKPAVLVKVDSGDRAQILSEQTSKLIATLKAERVEAPVVAVIANRVARARAAFTDLRTRLAGAAEVTLVIGRARAVEREGLAGELGGISTGIHPRPKTPHVIVATQTLEAGVDIDLDGLVTDAASLDALRQRFGRLNRDGRDITARGVILADKADRNPKNVDPVYGRAIAATLAALFPAGGETVDFGIAGLDAKLKVARLTGGAVSALLTDKTDAPVLMPAYVDLWTNTAPIPSVDPDPALFLHGPNRDLASVQLVWRADIDEDLDPMIGEQSSRIRALLGLAPPRAAEAIELPVWTVRRWLLQEHADVADVADVPDVEPSQERQPLGRPRSAFCWRGADDDRSRVVEARDIRPGDVIVVPASYGGCDRFGWAPEDTDPVKDVFDEASAHYAGKRYVVRVSPGLIRQAVFAEAEPGEPDTAESAEARRDRLLEKTDRIVAEVRQMLSDPAIRTRDLAKALIDVAPEPIRGQLRNLLTPGTRLERPAYPYGGEEGSRPGVVLVAPLGIQRVAGLEEGDGDAISTEDDEAGSFIGRALSLIDHSVDVEAKAREFAMIAGLSEQIADDLALAGWLHDSGKADLRFQRLLFDGDLLAMEATLPLAKSARGRSSRNAWARAGLPPHWRHEALSVRLALFNPRLQQAHDRALVLWLVGVHHGHGRPFFPHADPMDDECRTLAFVQGLATSAIRSGVGPQTLGFTLDGEIFSPSKRDPNDLRGLDWATMFRELKQRYGPWGLARLEAVLRLADHRASEEACIKKAQL